jgi:hypothetical protein
MMSFMIQYFDRQIRKDSPRGERLARPSDSSGANECHAASEKTKENKSKRISIFQSSGSIKSLTINNQNNNNNNIHIII